MKRNISGFTIVELLIVIVVIAILAAISIVAFNGAQARARDSARLSDYKSIQKALEMYRIDNGGYPDCSGGTYSAGEPVEWNTVSVCLTGLVPQYMKALPTDPINVGSSRYLYAVGYRKSGTFTQNNEQSDNYMLGGKLEQGVVGTYSGWWSYPDLNYLSGSNN
jgi:general secretion pathway protein G